MELNKHWYITEINKKEKKFHVPRHIYYKQIYNYLFIIPYIVKDSMPRKRRKAIASTVTPDIPYPKVRVEWIDCVSDSGWATEKEFDRMKLARPVNEGWLYSKDKDSVKLFASYDKDDDGFSFGDRTMIPRAWVKKIQKI